MPPHDTKDYWNLHRYAGFSLIELLVVITIISILTGMTVLGFSNSSHNARQISREITKTHLQQARAHAIATSTLIALIIPAKSSGKNGLRAMSLIEVEYIDGNYTPLKNEQGHAALLQQWAILPQNYHFVTYEMVESDLPTVIDHELTLAVTQLGHEIECHMIVFAPSGQIIYPTSGMPIRMAIAQVARNRNSFRISGKSNQKPIFDMLLVNRLTAMTQNVKP